jgi:hypothetical protein
MDKITTISINKLFWIKFSDHLISFGYKGLPKDIHFTFSFEKESKDFNFHITKNISGLKYKPQIKIILIEKKLFEVEQEFGQWLLNKMLVPLDLDDLKKKHGNNLSYISYKCYNQGKFSSATRKMVESFHKISKIKKKTRLKIQGDIEKEFNDIACSNELIDAMIDNIAELPTKFDTPTDGGIIIASEDVSVHVIRIHDKWFTLSHDMKPEELLSLLLNSELAKRLIWKIKRSLIILKNANSSEDTKTFNNPIRLIKVKKLRSSIKMNNEKKL